MFNMNIIDMKLRESQRFVAEGINLGWASARKATYVSTVHSVNEMVCKTEDFSTTKRGGAVSGE